jgi:hypothetical protein
MPLSYSKFTVEDLFSLNIDVKKADIFKKPIANLEPSDYLTLTIERGKAQNLLSEKAKSEFLIAPILAEISVKNRDKISFYSGYKFDVDKEKGLRGFCDYMFSLEPASIIIRAPVFSIVEAKNDNLENGIPQCIAELYAADIFNKRKSKNLPVLYGAVTFGFQWQFIRFENMKAEVDNTIYYLNDLPKILGILQHIVELQK